ncbi:MAG: TolC family outer membrane protein [Deltaproteobacteria bacterium]|jgi:adhesin transport system outer membrane protein|nr:TolC family outer membrane protein [Deltaproteobacteria bacterium]
MKNLSTLLLTALISVLAFGGTVFAAEADGAADATTPVTLNDTIALTIKNNPNIKAFQEYRQAAEFDRKRARSGFLPTLNASAGIGFEQWNSATTRTGNPQKDDVFYKRYDHSIVLSQTIWDGFAAWSRYRMTDSMLTSAEHRLFNNVEGLTLDAILAHMEVCRQTKMVQLSEMNASNHRRILSSQIDRQSGGVSTRADVAQTQARLARAESSLVEAKLALNVARISYKNLTGQEPGALVTPRAPEEIFASLENALAGGLNNNSQILSKLADIDTAFAQKDLDQSAFHPRIYLEVSNNYNWQVQDSDTYAWGTAVMLRAQWNLYNGHYDWYTLKGDKARIRQATRELQALRDNLAQETSSTWSEWLANIDQVKFYGNAVIYNTQTRDMYLQQFNVGARSLLDVLDSENELFSTSMQLVTAQMNEVAAQYRIITLGGTLLDYFQVDRAAIVVETEDDESLYQNQSRWSANGVTADSGNGTALTE